MKSFSNPCPSFHELKTFNVTVDGKIDIEGWKKKKVAGKPISLLHHLDAQKDTEITRLNLSKNETIKHFEMVNYCKEIPSYAHKRQRIQKRS